MRQWLNFLAGTCIVALRASGSRPAQGAELIVVASMGTVSGLNELAPAFTRATGHKLVISQESGPALEQRLGSNAPADLIAPTRVPPPATWRAGKWKWSSSSST